MANFSEWISRPRLSFGFHLLKRVVEEWSADNAMSWSASVAFYTSLSLAPLLILMIAIAGFVYGKSAAQGALLSGVRNLISPDISPAIQILLTRPGTGSSGWIAVVFGGLILFFGASSVLTELHDALNAIWDVPVDPNTTEVASLFRLIRQKAYSFMLIIGCGVLLLVFLVLDNWLGALETVSGWRVHGPGQPVHIVIGAFSFVAITFVFALIYKVIPDIVLTWRDVAVGGVATALLFDAGKQLISLYVSRADLGSAYGAAGSLIVGLVWVYYSTQVFFLGAEFTKVYAQTFGSHKANPPAA